MREWKRDRKSRDEEGETGEERMREKVHKVKKVSSKRTKKEKKGGRHSSVVSSVPSILRPWVRTPSTICIIKIVIGIKKGRK